MGTRIAAKLTLDGAGVDQVLDQKLQKANAWAAQMKRIGVDLFGGKSAQDSASAIDEIMRAQERLTSFRKTAAYQEANTVGKIKSVTSDLRDLAQERAKTEAGTSAALGLQLAMEQKLVQLRGLQRQQQAANVGLGPEEEGGSGVGVMGKIEKLLGKKFGIGAALKGVLAGMAFGSIHGLVETFTGAIMGGSKEGFEKLEEYAEKEKELIEKRVDLYLGAERRVGEVNKRIARATADVNSPRKSEAFKQFDYVTGRMIEGQRYLETDEEHRLRQAKGKEELDRLEIEKAQAEAALREHQRTMEDLRRQPGRVGDNEAARIQNLRADAARDIERSKDMKITGAERDAAEERAQQRLNEAAKLEYEVTRERLHNSEKIAEIEKERLAVGESGEQRVKRLREDAAMLELRSKQVGRTVAEQESDRAAATVKQLEAAQQALQNKVKEAAITDHLADLQRETAALGETTAERIIRLREDALRLEERSRDISRTEAQRDADRVKAAEKTAAAAALEYEWRNKPLTVGDAAARTPSGRHNTTRVGVDARNIERFHKEADRARREGRYDAAEYYGGLARAGEDSFARNDRVARQAAAARADAAAAKKDPWDERWGQMLADRNARLDASKKQRASADAAAASSGATKSSSADSAAAGELKSAASDLKEAAAELKNVQIEVDAS